MNEQPGIAPPEGVGEPDHEAIRLQLARILASPPFANAPSLERMLRYVVEHALAGEASRLKEYTLGVEVFGRGGDFDPRQDTIVRVQGRRLRDRLADYYRQQGVADPVGISLPKGHYVPTFHWRQIAHAPLSDTADEKGSRKPRRWTPVLLIALALVALVSLAITAALNDARQRPAADAGNVRHRVAVLPFIDISPNRDQEYIAVGLTEELIHRLTQSPSLQVTARTSAFAFKDRDEDIRAIARTLGVDNVIEGSVRRDGERLRITVQLIDAASGAHLWSQTYDRSPGDLFALQGEIAEAAAASLRTSIRRERAATSAPPEPEAYALYLRGRLHMNRGGEGDLQRAETMFRQAIRIDSRFAPAWAGLASALLSQAYGGELAWDAGTQEAGEAARKAVTLDPDLVEARLRLASYLYWAEGDQAGTAAELERAWRLDPENPLVLAMAAGLTYRQLKPAPAIELQRRALRRDPLVFSCALNLAAMLAEDGQFDAAETEIRRLVGLYPEPRPVVELVRARLRILQRRPDEALRLLKSLPESMPESVSRSHLLALAHAAAGDRQRANDILAVLLSPPRPGQPCHPHPAVTRAEAWMLLNQPERALAELLPVPWPDIRTAEGRYDFYTLDEARTSLLLRPLHADPRWQAWAQGALDVRKPVNLSPILGTVVAR